MGAKLVSEVASKTNDIAGDGTTTATVLTQAIVREGIKNVTAGANPIGIRRGIETAVAAAVEALKNNAIPVANKEAIAQVAAVSSRSEKVGEYISEAMEKLVKTESSPLKSHVVWKQNLKLWKECSLTVVTFHSIW